MRPNRRDAISDATQALKDSFQVIIRKLPWLQIEVAGRFGPKTSEHLLCWEQVTFCFQICLANAFQYGTRRRHCGWRISFDRYVCPFVLIFESSDTLLLQPIS